MLATFVHTALQAHGWSHFQQLPEYTHWEYNLLRTTVYLTASIAPNTQSDLWRSVAAMDVVDGKFSDVTGTDLKAAHNTRIQNYQLAHKYLDTTTSHTPILFDCDLATLIPRLLIQIFLGVRK